MKKGQICHPTFVFTRINMNKSQIVNNLIHVKFVSNSWKFMFSFHHKTLHSAVAFKVIHLYYI